MTDSTLSTVGNVYNIAHSAKVLTPKGLAKRTAKDTGKAMVYEYTASYRGQKSFDQMVINGDNGATSNSSNDMEKHEINRNKNKK